MTVRPDLTIRAVGPGDFEALAALINAGASQTKPPQHVPESIKRKIEGADKTAFRLVACAAEDIIGQAGLTFGFEPSSTIGRLTIAVRPDWHRRGVGRTLLGELLSAAQYQLGLMRAETNVFADNAAALALYDRLGFEIEARHHDRNGNEILLMAKTLGSQRL